MNSTPRPMSLRRAVEVARRHRRKMLFTFCVVMGLAVLATMLTPRTFTSEAKLFIRLGRETVRLDPSVMNGPMLHLNETREREINSVLEMLKSREALEGVVNALGAEAILASPGATEYGGPTDFSAITLAVMSSIQASLGMVDAEPISDPESVTARKRRDKAIRALSSSIKCTAARNSYVISVSASAGSPAMAQKILNTYLDAYGEQHVLVNQTSGAKDFFTTKAKELQEKVQAKAQELTDARNRLGVSTTSSERTVLDEQRTNLSREMLSAQAELASAEGKLKSLRTKLTGPPTTSELMSASGGSEETIDHMRNELYKLEIEVEDLASKYTDKHPVLESKRAQVEKAQEKLYRQEFMLAQSQANSLRNRLTSVESRQDEIKAKLVAVNEQEAEVNELERQQHHLETLYKNHMESRDQVSTDMDMDAQRLSNVKVGQRASFPVKASFPKPSLMLPAGLMLALLSAFGLALIAESWSTNLQTVDDVEAKLGIPVLASIPELPLEQVRRI